MINIWLWDWEARRRRSCSSISSIAWLIKAVIKQGKVPSLDSDTTSDWSLPFLPKRDRHRRMQNFVDTNSYFQRQSRHIRLCYNLSSTNCYYILRYCTPQAMFLGRKPNKLPRVHRCNKEISPRLFAKSVLSLQILFAGDVFHAINLRARSANERQIQWTNTAAFTPRYSLFFW